MVDRTVLISGGGLRGRLLPFWLAAAGFRPTLIEQAPQLRAGSYVIDFWGLGYWIAERMGLGADINRVGYHVREMRIVNDSGKRVTGFGTDVFGELTNGRYVILARSDLSRLLFEKIKDTTEIIFGDEIAGFEEKSDCVSVRLKHGAKREFDLVICAFLFVFTVDSGSLAHLGHKVHLSPVPNKGKRTLGSGYHAFARH
ncbi:hypothetical protein FJ417_21935 [Mesorhizobium sp. B3-1-7]|uniref:hypothetical protein n=1 Tax=Mesorhizobium sp. B3-1-7 TaxID=2589894 RepID=UPI00112CFDB2|nr:hypothetical protein [Mesorhizobium sp. B3-1-7]TPI57435.1 hypothetical protein FJ417_21935 [Mesorhizobium sp. B3-1-7]